MLVVICERCVAVTSWQLVMVGSASVTAASIASTTFCVLPFKGLDPHDASGSGTTVGVAVEEVVAVAVDVGVSRDDDCACADRRYVNSLLLSASISNATAISNIVAGIASIRLKKRTPL